ncbi:MAG TPA: siphovirus Gp157 family protein [Phycisphaerales bacterium]|nr:siphovirus Gp157 family protein [Phycisphaerales bacterium]
MNAAPSPELLPPDPTLDDLLVMLEHNDSGIHVLTHDQMKAVGAALARKVDAIRYRLDEWRDEALRHRAYAEEHSEAARAVEAKAERLKAYVAWSMQANGFERLTGERYAVRLQDFPKVVYVDDVKPTASDFASYPDFVRVTYAWNTSAIKSALSRDTHQIAFARLEANPKPVIDLKRGQ